MKKLFALLAAVLCLGAGHTAAQAAEQVGVYVAPKFIYGYTMMNDLKGGMTLNSPLGSEKLGSASSSEDDDAWGGALAIGYDFGKNFQVPVRAELEYAIFSRVEGKVSADFVLQGDPNTISAKQKLDIQTLMVNVYYDIDTGTPFTPYVGAGLGAAFVDAKAGMTKNLTSGGYDMPLDVDSSSESTTNFAWQVGAGLGWNATENLAVDLGYRFVSLGEVESDTMRATSALRPGISADVSSKTEDLYMHQVVLGLRYTF